MQALRGVEQAEEQGEHEASVDGRSAGRYGDQEAKEPSETCIYKAGHYEHDLTLHALALGL